MRYKARQQLLFAHAALAVSLVAETSVLAETPSAYRTEAEVIRAGYCQQGESSQDQLRDVKAPLCTGTLLDPSSISLSELRVVHRDQLGEERSLTHGDDRFPFTLEGTIRSKHPTLPISSIAIAIDFRDCSPRGCSLFATTQTLLLTDLPSNGRRTLRESLMALGAAPLRGHLSHHIRVLGVWSGAEAAHPH